MKSNDKGEAMDEGPGWSADILAMLEDCPAGVLADYYFSEIELDPDCEFLRAQQLRDIVQRRGLSIEELGKAWDELSESESNGQPD